MSKSKTKKLKPIPKFKSEQEEAEFWLTHDTTDYVDWSKAKLVRFPNLKLTSRAISIRLTDSLLEDLKMIANRKDVPYQSLIKIMLHEAVRKELNYSKKSR